MLNMVGKNCEAQELTIRLLMLGSIEQRKALYYKARDRIAKNPDGNHDRMNQVLKQLELCCMMAGQLNDYQAAHPKGGYLFADFDFLAKTIIARQKDQKKKEQKDPKKTEQEDPGKTEQEDLEKAVQADPEKVEQKETSTALADYDSLVKINAELQKVVEKVKQKEISAAMGLEEKRGNSRISAIREGSPVKLPEVEALCAVLQDRTNPKFDEGSRRFWKNMCYRSFSYLRMADTRNGPVMECLQTVWAVMDDAQREQAKCQFVPFTDWFENKLVHDSSAYDLYGVLRKAWENANWDKRGTWQENGDVWKKEDACGFLGICSDTWNNYKRDFEQKQIIYPKNALTREDLLLLAVIGKLSVDETVKLIAEAGYSFQMTPEDTELIAFLQKRDRKETISAEDYNDIVKKINSRRNV